MDLFTMALLAGAYLYGKKQNELDSTDSPVAPALPKLGPPPAFSAQQRARVVDEYGTFRAEPTKAIDNALLTSGLEQVESVAGLLTFRLVPLMGPQSALDFVQNARAQGASVYASLTCLLRAGSTDRLLVIAGQGQSMPSTHFALLKPAPAPKKTAKKESTKESPKPVNGIQVKEKETETPSADSSDERA